MFTILNYAWVKVRTTVTDFEGCTAGRRCVCDQEKGKDKELPAGWIEQPTSSLRVTRSTTELSGPYD